MVGVFVEDANQLTPEGKKLPTRGRGMSAKKAGSCANQLQYKMYK